MRVLFGELKKVTKKTKRMKSPMLEAAKEVASEMAGIGKSFARDVVEMVSPPPKSHEQKMESYERRQTEALEKIARNNK